MKKLLLSALFGASCIAFGQVIFQQNFSTLSNGALNGQNGWTNNTSSGGTGGLTAEAENVAVSAVNLNYPNYGNSTKAITQKQVDQDGPGHLFPSAITSGTYYFSFLANFSAYPFATSYYDVIRILNGAAFSTSARVWVLPGSTALGYRVGIKIGDSINPAAITASDYAFNQTHLFVVKYTINPGTSDDTMKLYIDPVFENGEPTTPTLTAPTATYEYSNNVDRVAFPYNTPKAGKAVGNIGLLSIARTWQDLDFPETLSVTDTNKENNFLRATYSKNNQELTIFQEGNKNEMVDFYNMEGKLITSFKLNSDKIQKINISTPLLNGTYLLKIRNSNKKSTQKILIH